MHDIAERVAAWNSFYVMIGSSSAALTGLMFVVISLVRDTKNRATPAGVSTFTTPTVVHFSAALFVSACLCAPIHAPLLLAALLALAGAGGLAYVLRVAVKSARLTMYRPDAEDWTFHTVLPLIAYAALVAAALHLDRMTGTALYLAAGGVVVLIFAGIHNAWDVVTYITIGDADPDETEAPAPPPA